MSALFFLAYLPLVSSFSILHITDVHIDPYYSVGSIAQGCYCESHDTCPRFGPQCHHTDNPALAAGPFGDSDADCATPSALWGSAMTFINTTLNDTPYVFFTGDFGSAGLAAACDSGSKSARQQILDVITTAFDGVRTALPSARVYGSFGNHDTSSDSGWGSSSDMAWLLPVVGNASGALGKDLSGDPSALATLQTYGWYTTVLSPTLSILSINTNYWATYNDNSAAEGIGELQFQWFTGVLTNASAAGRNVWILGHIPPQDGSWKHGYYTRYRSILSRFPATVTAAFFGHTHVDQLTLVRSCSPPPAPPTPPTPQPYSGPWVETRGVEWCSGGNFPVGDIWGLGFQPAAPWCPYVPVTNGTQEGKVALCETLCGGTNATTCAGFTFYPSTGGKGDACCFRTDTHNKPLNPNSTALCFEKALAPPSQCGTDPQEALHVLFAAPSLTEGYPPSNPGLRVYQVDALTNAVQEAVTWSADIRQGNKAWDLVWEREYTATLAFNLSGGAGRAGAWEEAFTQWAASGSAGWALFQDFYVKGYANPGCEGACKESLLGWMNGTAVDV